MFTELLTRASRHLPSQCALCRAWPARAVCDACVARFGEPRPRCATCAIGVPPGLPQCGACVAEPPPLDACHAAVTYAWPWAGCIASFKFGAAPGWAGTFATLLRSTPWVEPALDRCDLVLPMPLSRQRLRERGFNQALEIARRLASGRTDATLLLRVRDTRPQTSLDRADRQANVQGAFAVDPLRADVLRGCDVVLVDDVMTSGASLFAAARILRQAGAARVTALAVARTEAD